jgi:hypothetical protein
LERDPEITTVLFKETVWQTSKDNNKKIDSFQTKMNYVPEIVDFRNNLLFSTCQT